LIGFVLYGVRLFFNNFMYVVSADVFVWY